MQLTLENIIKAARRQDRSAQEKLYEYSYRKLLNRVLRYARDKEEGEWLFNLAMLKIFKGLDAFKIGSNYDAWASVILKRTGIDHVRKNALKKEILVPVDIKD